MFEHTYETRYGDYKDYETVKISSVLDMVQDISTRHSSQCGFDIKTLKKMNVAWLMQGINVSIVRPIKTGEAIKICTAVRNIRPVNSERGCIIKQNGETVAKTIVNWFTFDTAKQKICRIPKEVSKSYICHDFEDDFFEYKSPEIFDNCEKICEIKVSNKDIDTNIHLNNQKSAEILMDAMPFDFAVNDIKILYKRPAYLGDVLELCSKKIEDGYYVHLQTNEKEICVAGTFKKI